jgi:hypothetical protein
MTKTIPAALAAAVLAVALAACGSSDSASTSTSAAAGSTGSSTAPQQQGRGQLQSAEVQKCLEDQGVTLPSFRRGDGPRPEGGTPPAAGGSYGGPPQGGGLPGMSEAERAKLQAALKKCGVTVPDRGANGQGNGARPDVTSAAYQKRVNAYVACVRKAGFDLPDPDFSGKGPIFDPAKVDQSDPKFQAASRKCQSLLRPQAS